MDILNKMFQGSYVLEDNHIGHEFINLISTDNGKYYIWLNSTGSFNKTEHPAEEYNVFNIRSLGNKLYEVLSWAKNCHICDGAAPSPIQRQNLPDAIYSGIKLCDFYPDEKEKIFATFEADTVLFPKSPLYLTTDQNFITNNTIFYCTIKSRQSMREYVSSDLSALKNDDFWEKSPKNIQDFLKEYGKQQYSNQESYFSFLNIKNNELCVSNAIAHFLVKTRRIPQFLSFLEKFNTNFETEKNSASNYRHIELFREKHNIDLFFLSKNSIVVIENKIDSFISGINNTETSDEHLKKTLKDLITGLNISEKQDEIYNDIYKEIAAEQNNVVSQLSKYYIIARAYAINMGIDPVNLHFYILEPDYRKNQNEKLIRNHNLLFASKYNHVSYSTLLKFFKKLPPCKDLNGFIQELKFLSSANDFHYENAVALGLKKRIRECRHLH